MTLFIIEYKVSGSTQSTRLIFPLFSPSFSSFQVVSFCSQPMAHLQVSSLQKVKKWQLEFQLPISTVCREPEVIRAFIEVYSFFRLSVRCRSILIVWARVIRRFHLSSRNSQVKEYKSTTTCMHMTISVTSVYTRGCFCALAKKLSVKKTQTQEKFPENSKIFCPKTQRSGNFGVTLGKILNFQSKICLF